MNDENQKNEALEAPVTLTIPDSITVPAFAFLVVLNPDWRFTSQERKASPSWSVSQPLFHYVRPETPTHIRAFE